MGATTKGRILITNEIITKCILPDELDHYLSQGWRRGRKGSMPSTIPCKICGKPISPYDGKSGICRKCFVENGYQRKVNNDPEIIEKRRIRRLGEKRSDEFRQKQSKNMKKYYKDHPERRKIQGRIFSKAWKEGKHDGKERNQVSNCHSKAENMMFNALVNNFGDQYVTKSFFTRKGESRQVYPDAILYGCIAIEYNGDYFHGNPEIYGPDDIVSFNWRAEDLWELDKFRYDLLLTADVEHFVGSEYTRSANILKVVVIWENDVKHLTTQEDWNEYIRIQFSGYDEFVST